MDRLISWIKLRNDYTLIPLDPFRDPRATFTEHLTRSLIPLFPFSRGVKILLAKYSTLFDSCVHRARKLALVFQASKNYGWASSGCSILSEIGTMHLEFTYLSDITNNPVFKSKVENVRKVLKNLDKPRGLYPNYIHPRTGKWGQRK